MVVSCTCRSMELRGYTNSVLPLWYFTLCSVIVVWSTVLEISYATIPTLTLSNTNLTVRKGEMLELRCEVDQSIRVGNDVGDFRWEHYRNSTDQKDYYTTRMPSVPRVNVTESPSDTTYSVLEIDNLSPMDSGVIKCVYNYPDGTGSRPVSVETSLCVSDVPGLPACFATDMKEPSKNTFSLLCTTADMALCPLDISLQIRFASNGTILDSRQKYFPIEKITNVTNLANDGYVCTLRSYLFPSSNTTCRFKLPETTTLTISSSDANNKKDITVETNEQTTVGVYVTTNKNEPVTFSKLQVIIAASAAGGGVLLITIFICIIIACCKRCNRLNEKAVDKDASETQSQNSDKKHQNSDILLLERTHQTGQRHEGRKDSMPPYAKPDKSRMKNIAPAYDIVHENNPSYYIINDETSNSALYASADEVDDQQQGQYASVPQTYEEACPDSDREKVLTPHLSPHEYAYASFDLTSDAPPPEDAANRPAGEGFVDNSIYEPSLG